MASFEGIVKMLGEKRRDGCVHDAMSISSTGVRGVRLTDDSFYEGCWLPVALTVAISSAHTAAPAQNLENPSSIVSRQAQQITIPL